MDRIYGVSLEDGSQGILRRRKMADVQERIGQSIGDYRLLRLVGQGSFGTVYLAEHLHDHSSAAIKVLHIPLTGQDALHAFLTEARTMRLRHPHITSILDFGLHRREDLPYLVMTYAEGGSLRDRYPQGTKLPHKIIDMYVQQLASALQYAHDRRIIHCDVKPENMLLSGKSGAYSFPVTLQLSDFGIAKMCELVSLSSQQKGGGTPAYTAPEQSQGRPSPASDQYSLAIVVYEWLTGRRPFQGAPLAVMMQHYRVAPPSLRSVSPEVSPRVEQVILKALAKSPEDRFPTVTHFAEALHAALQEDATQLLSQLDTHPSTPSDAHPVIGSDVSLLQTTPPDTNPPLAETYSPTQSTLASPSNLDTPDPARSVETTRPTWPTVHPQKQRPSVNRRHKALIAFLCLILLLGGGGAIWLVMAQQQAAATKAALASLATKAANAYQAGETKNGVQFGFDAAHTHSNPYERVLNTTNVTDIKQLWSFPTQAKIFSSPVVANGMVYVGSYDHKLYAFDATCRHNCLPLWSFITGDQINSSPAVANGMVYVGSNDHSLYAFDATCRCNCQPLWSFSTGQLINSSPVVANGIVYIGSDDGKLYAFDAACRYDCQPLWSFQTGGPIASSPAVANGMVYVGSYDRNLYAFDASCRSNCQPLWSFATGGYILSSPAVAHGMVYVGSGDSVLYAFDAACHSSCQPLWSFTTGAGSYINSSPTVANGVVYIGAANGK